MNLTVLLDQNIPLPVCSFIRDRRPEWRVLHVSHLGMSGATDESILQTAQQMSALVITFDEDFADARMFPVGSHCGVVRLRVWPTTTEVTEIALARVFDTLSDEDLPGSLIIVDQTRIRVRRSAQHG